MEGWNFSEMKALVYNRLAEDGDGKTYDMKALV